MQAQGIKVLLGCQQCKSAVPQNWIATLLKLRAQPGLGQKEGFGINLAGFTQPSTHYFANF
jgi:hypothetical protein